MLSARHARACALAVLLALSLALAGTAQARDVTGISGNPGTPFTGIDGLVHLTSPVAIKGRHGYFYIGSDFDTACAFGPALGNAMDGMARLAAIIARSGRTVVWTIAPNKSAVEQRQLPTPLPQDSCARRGMALQTKLLDTYRDAHYVPLRRALATAPGAYWRTDSHWSTVGTSVAAEQVARRLSPKVAALQHYRPTERTHRGDLSYYVPGKGAETAPARVPRNGVVTRPGAGSPAYDPTLTSVYTDLSWVSSPRAKTYPGDTLLLGDSFTYVSFEAMSNVFRKGRFIWTGTQSDDAVVAAIKQADTVVLSVVQRFAPITPLISPAFQDQVRTALRG
jgi:hypothetical protein